MPEEARTYAAALSALTAEPAGAGNVEAVFGAGVAATRRLLRAKPGEDSLLERLDALRFAELEALLPGFRLTRDELLEAGPVPSFFLALAEAHGDVGDAAFFRLLGDTIHPGGWPRYVEPLTDHGGCRRLGSPLFAELLAGWRDYARRFPGRYAEHARRQLAHLEADLLHPAACEERAAVLRAYRRLLLTQPDAGIAERVRARIAEIEAGSPELRFGLAPEPLGEGAP